MRLVHSEAELLTDVAAVVRDFSLLAFDGRDPSSWRALNAFLSPQGFLSWLLLFPKFFSAGVKRQGTTLAEVDKGLRRKTWWYHVGVLFTVSPGREAAIVRRLQAIVARYALTKVPQATADPSCPPFSGLNTTDPSGATKLYIGPWCD